MKNVLFVLTSNNQLGNTDYRNGFGVDGFASPYYLFKENNMNITLASPKGGSLPIDPENEGSYFHTDTTRKFYADKETKNKLANTVKLETLNHSDYDAIFYPGSYGPLWDLVENKNSIKLIEDFYRNNKPVVAVCHGPAVFKNATKDDGSPLVSFKNVTGFTNSEEEAVQLTSIIPFLVEEMLKDNGGLYSKGRDWAPYAQVDGLLITGQNPASSKLVAEILLRRLKL